MAKYVISYDKGIDFSTLQSSLIASGCEVHQVFDSLGVLTVESSNTDFSSITGVLAHEIEPELTVDVQWHLNRICSEQLPMRKLYLTANKGLGSTVYLMDSGVDTTHPELSDANIEQLWSWDGNMTDSIGHGTGMASIIVGKTLGVSSEATLKSVKIPTGQSIPVSILLNAFDVILNDHLSTPGVKVVNCSWNIPKSLILDTKITELEQHGLIIVAAAGNTVADANTLSPVGLNSVLGVAASDAYDRVINWGASAGSNWGPDVDITAPGIDVTIATLGGGTEQQSGTSIAAAVVAGAVCQIIVKNPSVTSSVDIQNIVVSTAREDVLFRNEAIYGTTPNRLLYVPAVDLLLAPENKFIEIQKGTTVTIPLETMPIVSSIKIDDLVIGSSRRTAPSWAVLTDNTLTVSPPATIDRGRYVLEMHFFDAENVNIGYGQLTFMVYDSSMEEFADTPEVYIYHQLDENENVVVVLSACGGSCSTNYECALRSKISCGCSFGTCIPF